MGVNLNKNGTVLSTGQGVNPNIQKGCRDWSGWTVDGTYTKTVDNDGFTICSINKSGNTSNVWLRLVSTMFSKDLVSPGITVSFDFMCDNLSNWDDQGVIGLQQYNSAGTRIGWYEARLNNTSIFKYDPLVNGKWTHITAIYPSSACVNNISVSGYTSADIAKMNVTLVLIRNGSIHYKKPKIELGSVATPWVPNISDPEYLTGGFYEEKGITKIGNNWVQASEIYEI